MRQMLTFTFQPKNVLYRNLHYPIQDGLSLLISKRLSHNFAKKLLPTLICLWCTLTCLCTVISRSSLMRLLFPIVIDSALMPPWLVKTWTSFWTSYLQMNRRIGNKWIRACIELAATHSCNLFPTSLHKGEVALVVKENVVTAGETSMVAH